MGAGGLIVVSAADSSYFPLLQDAVASVRALNREIAIGLRYRDTHELRRAATE